MRTLNDHVITEADAQLVISAVDEPGAGGANHLYRVETDEGTAIATLCDIGFQNGTVNEAGINGVTENALLAVLIDRMRSFQAGPFRCRENACVLTHLEEALHWNQQRTIRRMRQGIEGKHTETVA